MLRDRLLGLNRWLSVLAAGALLLGLTLYAPAAAEGVREGLRIAAGTALPALFPFFVAGALTVRTGLAAAIGRGVSRPFHALYGLPGSGAAALALGLLGGYPVGAQVTVQLFQNGQLSREEAERLLGFVNCSGPAFLISMGGAAVCGSVRAGFALYGVHVAAALMTGLALTRSEGSPRRETKAAPCEAFSPAFVGAVGDGLATALKVTAFVVFFSVLLSLGEALGVLETFAAALRPLLRLAGLPPEGAEAFARGLIELTNGLAALPALGLPGRSLFPLISTLAGFGGLSVHCQTLSILSGSGLSPRPYLVGKAVHALIAYALASIWCAALPGSVPAFAQAGAGGGTALTLLPVCAALAVISLCWKRAARSSPGRSR